MIGASKWLVILLLGAFPGCTVGETPPDGSPAPPTAERPADPDPELPPGDARGDEATAGELLSRARLAYEAGEVEEALDLSLRVRRDHPGTSAAAPATWVAARSAFAVGRYQEAAELAEAAARAGAAPDEARALVEVARDAQRSPDERAVVVGAVLPRTGSRIMVRYADWLLEGIQLAVDEAEVREGRRIELVVADNAAGMRTREAVAEVERQGAVAVIGPLMPDQVSLAAEARSTPDLVLVSPTAPEDPRWRNVFSINGGDTRGAQELGRYAAEAGLTQAAMLYPRQSGYREKAQAFAVEFEAAGGQIRVSVPYDSGTTTFSQHMQRIIEAIPPSALSPMDTVPAWLQADTARASPGADSANWTAGGQEAFALFISAPAADIRQIAPQVAFYGLDATSVQILGDEAWASGLVRRVVPASDLEGVIAASRFLPERADGLADPDFIRRYEQAHRRSLENELPALGYDAANLVLQALPRRLLEPEALSIRFGLLAGLQGATGTFSVRADRVVRTPYLVVIRGGDLVPAPLPWEYRPPSGRPSSGGRP